MDFPTEELTRFKEAVLRSGKTVSAAESCTGGFIGASITSLPGASSFFMGSAVTYSNEVKERLLHVPRGILFAYGAVSEQTARCMSRGAAEIYGADVAVAVTGIAGPGGATPEKPVGLVYISVSGSSRTECRRFVFEGDRDSVRYQTTVNALNMLSEFLEAE